MRFYLRCCVLFVFECRLRFGLLDGLVDEEMAAGDETPLLLQQKMVLKNLCMEKELFMCYFLY